MVVVGSVSVDSCLGPSLPSRSLSSTAALSRSLAPVPEGAAARRNAAEKGEEGGGREEGERRVRREATREWKDEEASICFFIYLLIL